MSRAWYAASSATHLRKLAIPPPGTADGHDGGTYPAPQAPTMPSRDFYLAAYDVSSPRRLAAALALVRGYTTGGQKSVHEVFLTRGQRLELLHDMALLLDEDEDRFFLLRLDPSAKTYALGVAARPADPDYFYVG